MFEFEKMIVNSDWKSYKTSEQKTEESSEPQVVNSLNGNKKKN